ncbi:YcaO-like family protein [Sandaracinobacteroides saxicola]|uniref:YcaO-like family protein n=1 Tax=Sandaracinobacteroides saxicola TaxID=2759707 RepID=A0A7G5IIS9_9SPHN|nr:YcaO-like family protein [Sandaracinobacteroides saxicola]QMW23271.1 YcaO-like family protein [Sandaracinobacteroides saxicola]
MRLFGKTACLPKQFRDGTHRSRPPEDTVARLKPLMPRLGITRLANITGLDRIGLPVWIAVRPNSRGLSTAQGKGLTDAAAQASAIMESIECWHAETIVRPMRIASAAALRAEGAAFVFDGLPHYEDRPPRADIAIPWVEGEDLLGGGTCLVPLETVSADYVVGAGRAMESAFVQSSNGLSGGNHPLEACVHALAELIERDQLTMAQDAVRTLDPAIMVDPASVEDTTCRQLFDRLAAAGLMTGLFDLTGDLGIPVYGATIVDADSASRWRTLPAFNGYGCHLTPAVALLRALTEAAQSRLTHISGSRDDILPADFARAGNDDDVGAYRQLLRRDPQRRFDRGDLATDDFEGDLARLLTALRRRGIRRAVAVDLSRPDIGVAVVRLVCPGLAAPVPLLRGRRIRQTFRSAA